MDMTMLAMTSTVVAQQQHKFFIGYILASEMTYRVTQEIGTFCTPYNFIRYWPIFEVFSLSKSGEHL